MSEDFVTQLRLQLREAAEREAQRSPAARLGREAAARRLWRPALALAALLLLALGVVNALHDGRHDRTTPAGHGLRLELRRPLVGQGGAVAAGFGSLWVGDASTGDVLRLDPRTSAVRARIHVGGEAPFDVGAGGVWALAGRERLLRIDPATDRIVARVRLPEPAAGVLVAGDTVWVGTDLAVEAIAPSRNAVVRTLRVGRAGFQADGIATDGRRLYVSRADGTLLVYDARTGARLPSPGVAVYGAVAAERGTLFTVADRRVSALDVRTARTRWTTDLRAQQVNYVVLGGGSLWVEGTGRDTQRDFVWRLDPATGRVTGSVQVPEFGASDMAVVGRRLWVVSSKGVLQIVG